MQAPDRTRFTTEELVHCDAGGRSSAMQVTSHSGTRVAASCESWLVSRSAPGTSGMAMNTKRLLSTHRVEANTHAKLRAAQVLFFVKSFEIPMRRAQLTRQFDARIAKQARGRARLRCAGSSIITSDDTAPAESNR